MTKKDDVFILIFTLWDLDRATPLKLLYTLYRRLPYYGSFRPHIS